MKPIIGVTPLWDDEKQSLWMLPGYMDGIARAGGIPMMLPLAVEGEDASRLTDLCDGILLTGGHDISPALYGESPLEDLVCACPERDRLESIMLRQAIRADKPVLGICRGIQFINAALGGTLYQDLPLQHPSDVEHHQTAPYDRPSHEVDILADTPLRACLGAARIAVNSYHHQAVRALADSLAPMAVAPDGLIEAVFRPQSRFLWAVQWHPEFSFRTDESSRRIFRAFVEAARPA